MSNKKRRPLCDVRQSAVPTILQLMFQQRQTCCTMKDILYQYLRMKDLAKTRKGSSARHLKTFLDHLFRVTIMEKGYKALPQNNAWLRCCRHVTQHLTMILWNSTQMRETMSEHYWNNVQLTLSSPVSFYYQKTTEQLEVRVINCSCGCRQTHAHSVCVCEPERERVWVTQLGRFGNIEPCSQRVLMQKVRPLRMPGQVLGEKDWEGAGIMGDENVCDCMKLKKQHSPT